MIDKLMRLGNGDLSALSDMLNGIASGLSPVFAELKNNSNTNDNSMLNPAPVQQQQQHGQGQEQGQDNNNYNSADMSPKPY